MCHARRVCVCVCVSSALKQLSLFFSPTAYRRLTLSGNPAAPVMPAGPRQEEPWMQARFDTTEQVEPPPGAALPAPIRRHRLIHHFGVTVNIPEYRSDVRTRFAETFREFRPFVIAVEEYHDENLTTGRGCEIGLVRYHIHAYFNCKQGMKWIDFKQVCAERIPDLRPNIIRLRNWMDWVVYITKEDRDVYFSVKACLLNINYRAWYWAMTTSMFEPTDKFLVANRSHLNFWRQYFYQAKRDVTPKRMRRYNHLDGVWYTGWPYQVYQWYEETCGPWFHKRKQLFLWGPTHFGKTTVVRTLVGKQNMPFIFTPGVGRFAFEGLDVDRHRFVLIDDFIMDDWWLEASMLKKFLAGEEFVIDKKSLPSVRATFKGHTFILSNDEAITDEALLSRLVVVYAGCHYQEPDVMFVPPTVKGCDSPPPEVVSSVEVIDLAESE